jgi:small subunit ribosomal protein S1
MFSDNENPGAELSAGQTATAATAAPEQTANVETAQASEPAVVTVHPTEPVAAPDGVAAVEHTNVSETVEASVDSGEPATESNSEMEQLMEQYAVPHQAPAEGEIESGQVVAITDLGVLVSLGGKTEGLIPAQEFAELDGPFPLQVGQPVEVQRTGERKEGMVLLSYQRVKRRRAWGKIEEAYRGKSDINGKIVDSIKGGLVVDIGVRAFLPASQADLHPVRDLEEWKGRDITVRVLKMNRKRGNVVVSRRAILDEQQASQRQAMLESMAEGQIVKGIVKNVTGYGAFVDLGGIDGLLHITDMSWSRVASPLDAVSPGEEVEVKILKYDKEKGRV